MSYRWATSRFGSAMMGNPTLLPPNFSMSATHLSWLPSSLQDRPVDAESGSERYREGSLHAEPREVTLRAAEAYRSSGHRASQTQERGGRPPPARSCRPYSAASSMSKAGSDSEGMRKQDARGEVAVRSAVGIRPGLSA